MNLQQNTVYRKCGSICHSPNLKRTLHLGHRHYTGKTGKLLSCATFTPACLKSKLMFLNYLTKSNICFLRKKADLY